MRGFTECGNVTGTVTVSYPDEAGFKPKYVEQAAAAVKAKFSGLNVKIDLQKINSDDYYTKLLLQLDNEVMSSMIAVEVSTVAGAAFGKKSRAM